MFLLILILVIVLVLGHFWARRYDMSEKVDKGIEICYWKLSYRRKFIRTLWTIPVSIIMVIQLHRKYQSYLLTGIVSVIFFILTCSQAVYNYRKWKKGIE